MMELCEQMFRISHKAASVGPQLDELKHKLNQNQIPSAIHAKPVKVQVCKEYARQSSFVSAERALERTAVAVARAQLACWIDIKENEFRYLYGLASKENVLKAVNKIVAAHQEGYRRFLVVPTDPAPTPSPMMEGTEGPTIAPPARQPTPQPSLDPLPTPIELGWESALPLFPTRAIELGHVSVQRDLAARMRKMNLRQEAQS